MHGTSLAYRRETKILQLEIKSLNERQSNDPFSPFSPFSPLFRKLQAQRSFYKNIDIDLKRAAVFQLDGKIEASYQAIMPKKAFVMFFCILFGLMLGVTLRYNA